MHTYIDQRSRIITKYVHHSSLCLIDENPMNIMNIYNIIVMITKIQIIIIISNE